MPLPRLLAQVLMSGVTPILLEALQRTGAAEAALDLVQDQQDAVLVAELPQAFQVACRCHVEAAFALHGFDDDGREFSGATVLCESSSNDAVRPSRSGFVRPAP
jgi:hypothetical protein